MNKKDEISMQWKKFNLSYHGKDHAKEYFNSDKEMFYSRDHIIIRRFFSDKIKKDESLIDLGCGTGRWFHIYKNASLTVAIDYSFEMLKKAKERIILENLKDIKLIRGDISNIPLKDNLFDCAISIGVLAEHAPLNDNIFREARRILKPKGKFIFTASKNKKSIILKMKLFQVLNPLFPLIPKANLGITVRSFHEIEDLMILLLMLNNINF